MPTDETKPSKKSGTPKRRRRARRANGRATRRRILRAASSMFAASGYEATSLRQIAGAAEIDIATLKYHFGDKASLFAQIYRAGNERLLALIGPMLAALEQAESLDDVRKGIGDLVARLHDFVEENLPFIRLGLYRILEGSADIRNLEEELESGLWSTLDESLERLHERGLIRALDTRAFLVLLVVSFSAWFVAAQAKPSWLGEPSPLSPDGRERSEAFFRELLERELVPSSR